MAELVIIQWRDIPAQVVVRDGRERARRHLGERFEAAIDRAAMHAGMAGTDDYLEQWKRADPVTVEGDAETAAADAVARLDDEYPPERLQKLALAGGIEGAPGPATG